ncbi:hypothetical protein AC578_4387 [Pseudocercospora eumusae]|uniref:Uncharacterized protein n=1 Tax=Pseudocercospora eumusae TaxID=321146 RepID=A0A139H649_9PEZI|nr:hypothetical protein AC578_4387 [Pseudocercospora eumusae]
MLGLSVALYNLDLLILNNMEPEEPTTAQTTAIAWAATATIQGLSFPMQLPKTSFPARSAAWPSFTFRGRGNLKVSMAAHWQ